MDLPGFKRARGRASDVNLFVYASLSVCRLTSYICDPSRKSERLLTELMKHAA